MANICKILADEITLSTASTVGSASVVRVMNTDANATAVITLANSTANIASVTLNFAGSDESVLYLAKEPSQTLAATGTVKAVAVAYL